MNFSLTEEQQMLVDSIDRFVANDYTLAARRALAARDPGYSEDHWRLFAEMGLLGLTVPEEHGGMGQGAVDTCLVMRALGRGLVLEPLIPTSVVAVALIRRGGSAAQQASWLPKVAAGELKVALAVDELESHYELDNVHTTLADGRLNGRKSVVWHGASADRLIVVAKRAPRQPQAVAAPHGGAQVLGRPGDLLAASGLVLACIDAKAPGVTIENYTNLDGQRSAEVTLHQVAVAEDELLDNQPDAAELLDWALDHGRAALCAEAVGVMEKLHALLCDYLKTRVQFKQPLAKFQVLQHRVVDMLIWVEQSHSSALLAAANVDAADPVARRKAVSAAKSQIGRFGRMMSEQAIQSFGGMGMTDEFDAGHYVKRLLTIDLTWGNASFHLGRYADNAL